MSELDKLGDKTWRMNNLYRVKNKDGYVVKFVMNRPQQDYFGNRHSRNVILKSRQLGFTTFEIIDQLDDLLFTTDKLFASSFIAHKKDDAERILAEKLKFAWEHLPEEIKVMYKVERETVEDFNVDLGSMHINAIRVSTSIRSGTCQRIHISELSYPDKHDPQKAQEIIMGAIPALSFDGMLTIESTARGLTGQFHDIFMNAYKKPHGTKLSTKEYKWHFYNWTWDDYELGKITPELIEDARGNMPELIMELAEKHGWTEKETVCYYNLWLGCDGDMEFMKQEYPTTVEEAFEGSVQNLFHSEKVNLMGEKAGRREGDWTYFKDYKKDNVYALGADIAEGVNKDSSTIAIWDFTPLYKNCDYKPEIVAVYASNKISPTEFAYQILNGATRYGNCLVAPERNNHGHATIAQLRQVYPDKHIFAVGMDVTSITENKDARYGFLTTGASKSIMLNEFNDAVNQEIIDVWSKHLKIEMISYDKEDVSQTRKKKDQTNHWDLLIAAAIGWQMRKFVKPPRKREEQYVQANHDPYE